MGTMFWEKINRPESLDSVAEEVTDLIICAMARIGLLTWGTGASS